MKSQMIHLGVVGLDGHGPVFSEKVNSSADDLGARVVTAMPVTSAMVSDDVLDTNIEKTRDLGVQIVDDPEALAADVDGILILQDDGSQHFELVRNFAAAGKPMFIDKPIEVSRTKAKDLAQLCHMHSCPVFSASALRFCPETIEAQNRAAIGQLLSAMTYSPFMLHASMPGWIYYAIHSVEQLYALMGPGCRHVRCFSDNAGALAVGTWPDGRTGIARATHKGPHGFGLSVWGEKGVYSASVELETIYTGLLENVFEFVRTGTSPVSVEESVEVIGFLEAANTSMDKNGELVAVEDCV